MPGVGTLEVRIQNVASDVALEYWADFRGTLRQASGTDLFVIRNGKIVSHVVSAPEGVKAIRTTPQ
jgi:hypothetical protein